MAEMNVTNRGILAVTTEAFGTVRITWPDGVETELRRPGDDTSTLRLRVRGKDVTRTTIDRHYGRNVDGRVITVLGIERGEGGTVVDPPGAAETR